MQISEEVLYNTLAQINKKEATDVAKKQRQEQKAFDVVKTEQTSAKVDVQFELERKIIEMLLLYGSERQEFEDLVLKENEEGDLVLEPETYETKVYEKIYLDLQEDEIELTNENFKSVYYRLIESLNENDEFSIQSFMASLNQELVPEVSSILMEEEKYVLHDWKRRNIYPKEKQQGVAQLVGETILSLRCNLIRNRIEKLKKETENPEKDNKEVLEEIVNYLQLNKLLNAKLSRVIS